MTCFQAVVTLLSALAGSLVVPGAILLYYWWTER
jgi:hypothetical protein